LTGLQVVGGPAPKPPAGGVPPPDPLWIGIARNS
jgi:hypothetical protein